MRDVLMAAGPDDFLQPVNFREQMGAQMTSTMDEDGRCIKSMGDKLKLFCLLWLGPKLILILILMQILMVTTPAGRA